MTRPLLSRDAKISPPGGSPCNFSTFRTHDFLHPIVGINDRIPVTPNSHQSTIRTCVASFAGKRRKCQVLFRSQRDDFTVMGTRGWVVPRHPIIGPFRLKFHCRDYRLIRIHEHVTILNDPDWIDRSTGVTRPSWKRHFPNQRQFQLNLCARQQANPQAFPFRGKWRFRTESLSIPNSRGVFPGWHKNGNWGWKITAETLLGAPSRHLDTTFSVIIPDADGLIVWTGDKEGTVGATVKNRCNWCPVVATVAHRVIRFHSDWTSGSGIRRREQRTQAPHLQRQKER